MTPGATDAEDNGVLTFEPPRSSRVAAGACVVLAVVAAAVAAYGLGGGLNPVSGVAAALAAVLLAVLAWWIRPSRSHVRIDHGLVDIVIGDRQHRFDLTNEATELEVVGEPGERDWKLLFRRRGLDPVAVDGRMVDGEAFVEALRAWRPGL